MVYVLPRDSHGPRPPHNNNITPLYMDATQFSTVARFAQSGDFGLVFTANALTRTSAGTLYLHVLQCV